MDPDSKKLIEEFHAQGMTIRGIARKLGLNVKTVRRALGRKPRPKGEAKPPSKLEPFREKALELAGRGWRGPRILRELRSRGYTGSRTILLELIRCKRGRRKRAAKAARRFETRPGKESQVDWSPFRVPVGTIETVVQCFSMVLAYSRMLFIAFYRDQRLPTLLHAHVEALAYFQGSCERHVYDNMTTVTLGRIGKKPLWNPSFLHFSKHYGFKCFACRPKHANRKGKVERPFPYIWEDFLNDEHFASWADLNARARIWLDTTANVRIHGTTKRRPIDMYAEEKDCLIRLPEVPYPTGRMVTRTIQLDGYIPVDSSFYPVPGGKPGGIAHARVFPDRLEVLASDGCVLASYRVPDRPGRIFAEWGSQERKEPSESRTALETRFLARFPAAEAFLRGLHHRMKSLLPIHLRELERLVDLYGTERVARALRHAEGFRNFNALSVRRILERDYPNVVPEPPLRPAMPNPAALGALDDVDCGHPADYTIDTQDPTGGDHEDVE